jgi:hypothetical protein
VNCPRADDMDSSLTAPPSTVTEKAVNHATLPLPLQQQDQVPGHTARMSPRPDHGEDPALD